MNKKLILGIIGILFGIFAIILIFFLVYKNKDELVVTGEIIHKTQFAITVSDITDGTLYVVNINDVEYNVGDIVNVYSKGPVMESYPMQVNATKVSLVDPDKENLTVMVVYAKVNIWEKTLISEDMIDYKLVSYNSVKDRNDIYFNRSDVIGKYVVNGHFIISGDFIYVDSISFLNQNDNNETNSNNSNIDINNSSNNSSSNNNSSSSPSSSNNSNSNVVEKTEDDVIKYFNEVNTGLDNYSSTNQNVLKKGFVTIVDFLFYGGTIYGKTFNELSDSAKVQVLKVSMYIDAKIDDVFPGYKETISSTTGKVYTSIKSKIVATYLDVTTKICASNKDICEQAKSDFADMKKSFSLTWDFLKEIAGSAITSLSDWYVIWRET